MSTPYYKLLDFALILAASLLAYEIRFHSTKLPLEYLIPSAIFIISSVASLAATSFYNSTNSQLTSRKIFSLGSGLIIAAAITITYLFLTKTGASYSRIWFTQMCVISFILLLVSRLVIEKLFVVSTGSKCVILIGGNQTAKAAAETLRGAEALRQGIRFLKHFTSSTVSNRPIEDSVAQAQKYISRLAVDETRSLSVNEVWITSDIFTELPPSQLELYFSDTSATIVYVPEMPPTSGYDLSKLDFVLGIPTWNSSFRKSHKLNGMLKYVEDKLVAAAALMLLSPVIFTVAILIKLDSKGPVLYKQNRHGFGGKQFKIYKFRTMTEEASSAEFKQAVKDDPRITRIGKTLRRLSIDELPQLLNVLNGSMSIVGPRPHPMGLNESFRHSIDSYMQRHSVKPGITGLAQVHGFRGETREKWQMEQRISYDLEYVRNWSIALDIWILWRTITHLVSKENAY